MQDVSRLDSTFKDELLLDLNLTFDAAMSPNLHVIILRGRRWPLTEPHFSEEGGHDIDALKNVSLASYFSLACFMIYRFVL